MVHHNIKIGLLLIAIFAVGSCRDVGSGRIAKPVIKEQPATAPRLGPPVASLKSEPALRVRIAANVAVAQITSKAAVIIGPTKRLANQARPRMFQPPIRISRTNNTFIIQSAAQAMSWALDELRIDASPGHNLLVGGRRYPHGLVIVPARDGRNVDVVNHLPLETYLPGVLDGELYRSWHPQAFAAQAIAARSYAIWERSRRPGRHYDLEATTASQVYGGQVQNPKARAAVRQTRGEVLVYQGRVVPAFYSSCIGGTGQDATIAFPNIAPDIAPLRGGPRGDWDRASTYYRWGPIYRNSATLSRRIAAWGKARRNKVADVGSLVSINITRRSDAGRPASFMLTDRSGRKFNLLAESFRLACNFQVTGSPPDSPRLSKQQKLKSSHVDVTIIGQQVAFTNGRGFGHGVGMSQWGAQGLAKQGYKAASILAFYYPGAQIHRAY